ncbi:BHLH domain-containing protein [Mycena indigotica]|uniref:BHLH domain-containing protein n=1 Tax=Mycena indigotica TaxID=2126181 RepID=A0A8H6SE74_9AGAR|nr:BHLH domain-containing protein [Mycena indigotica]KAF7297322.1 BHLH domain-containing protein [Mycena indigotica]
MSHLDWHDLPLEIWLVDILPRLHSEQLSRLGSTCKSLLSITRPLLYCTVTLSAERYGQPNVALESVLSLLERDRHLASFVEALTLDARASAVERYSQNYNLIHPPSFRNMTRLKRLTIRGDISRSAGRKDVHTFLQLIQERNLDQLAFPTPEIRSFLLPLHHSDDQPEKLSNSKRLVFSLTFDYHNHLGPVIQRILGAAQPILTSISLHAPESILNLFFDLRFPHLQALELAVLTRLNPTTPAGFYQFLVHHAAQLEELSLIPVGFARGRQYTGISFEPSNGSQSKLAQDFLPRLRVLKAAFRTVEALARARIDSFQRLEKLVIAAPNDDEAATAADIRHMFDSFHGPLPALVDIGFHSQLLAWLSIEERLAFVPEIIESVSRIAGFTLEKWSGVVYFPNTDQFTSKAFSRLRCIVFPPVDLQVNALSITDFSSVFWTCETLEEIRIRNKHPNSMDEVWTVNRRARELICVGSEEASGSANIAW